MKEDFIIALKDALEIEGREIYPSDAFRDYPEWDSLTQLTLIAMLDENFGVEIETEDFNKLITIEDLWDEVKKRQEI